MKRTAWTFAIVAALFAASAPAASPAFAGATDDVHASTTATDAGAVSALALPGLAVGFDAADDDGADTWFGPSEGIHPRGSRRRPRGRYAPPPRHYGPIGAFSQIHGGFYDPEDDGATGALFGFRGGTEVDEHIRLGFGFDWSHRSDRNSAVVSEEPLPGGGTTVRRLELARSSSDLLPFMGFLEFSPGGGGGVRPYFGIGGGYEVLFVSAEDFSTGLDYDATFGGWGWQAWGGLAVPLSGRSSLNVEVYSNQAELSRDVDDAISGYTLREIVDADGMGMRFGLNWSF